MDDAAGRSDWMAGGGLGGVTMVGNVLLDANGSGGCSLDVPGSGNTTSTNGLPVAPSQSSPAPASSHLLMTQTNPASRRPESDEDADKVKRGSEDGFQERVEEASAVPMAMVRATGFSGFVEEEGICGSSFLTLLKELEEEGVITLHHGEVPPRLKGLCGWTVNEDKMDEWKRRRQTWFMQGKEGKQYKANSLYQFLRRLGFFPTEGTKRASHGLDFEGSRSFKWDGSRREKYIQSKKEKQALMVHANNRNFLRAGPGIAGGSGDFMGGMMLGGWQAPMEPPGRPLPVHPDASGMGGAGGMFQYQWNFQGLAHPQMQHVQHVQHVQHAPYPAFPPHPHPHTHTHTNTTPHPLSHAHHQGYPHPPPACASNSMPRMPLLSSSSGSSGLMPQQPPSAVAQAPTKEEESGR